MPPPGDGPRKPHTYPETQRLSSRPHTTPYICALSRYAYTRLKISGVLVFSLFNAWLLSCTVVSCRKPDTPELWSNRRVVLNRAKRRGIFSYTRRVASGGRSTKGITLTNVFVIRARSSTKLGSVPDTKHSKYQGRNNAPQLGGLSVICCYPISYTRVVTFSSARQRTTCAHTACCMLVSCVASMRLKPCRLREGPA